MITQKEMVSAIYNCVKKREKHLIDEKAFLISLSVGIPIDDFYEVDGRPYLSRFGKRLRVNCEKYLSTIDKYDENTILEASMRPGLMDISLTSWPLSPRGCPLQL